MGAKFALREITGSAQCSGNDKNSDEYATPRFGLHWPGRRKLRGKCRLHGSGWRTHAAPLAPHVDDGRRPQVFLHRYITGTLECGFAWSA
jgi:hypothetical protein